MFVDLVALLDRPVIKFSSFKHKILPYIRSNLRSGSIFVSLCKYHSGGEGEILAVAVKENVWEQLKLGLISGYIRSWSPCLAGYFSGETNQRCRYKQWHILLHNDALEREADKFVSGSIGNFSLVLCSKRQHLPSYGKEKLFRLQLTFWQMNEEGKSAVSVAWSW